MRCGIRRYCADVERSFGTSETIFITEVLLDSSMLKGLIAELEVVTLFVVEVVVGSIVFIKEELDNVLGLSTFATCRMLRIAPMTTIAN